MKIIALQAENLKRLVAVEIRPDGNLVEITGRNGQGKTSVLDAIWWALEGTTHIQAAPIRTGATEALIRLDLGELKVTRKFKAKEEGGFTTSISVENRDGARYPSPQAMLDALVGELSFDPLAFTRMKPADQLETLKGFVPGVDFAAIDASQKSDYEERTAVNRRAKELRAQAEGIELPAGPPPEAIDEAALVAELERAGEHNADIERRKGNRDQALRDIADKSAAARAKLEQSRQLQQQAAAAAAQADVLASEAGELQRRLEAAGDLPAPIDTGDIRTRIGAAKSQNAAVAAYQRKAQLAEQARVCEARSTEITSAMEARLAGKAAAISAAKLPVDGVSFGDGAVLLDGLPFDQASDAQQLRASIAIAAAMNPRLRVIRVRDGSLLDEDAMKLLAQFADERDMQVWIERVDTTGKVGFVLEDGRLRSEAAALAR